MLGGIERIHLIDPLDYPQFVWLLNSAYLALSDSGGIQEEMPSLGRPALVMRENTERPEGVKAGVCKLVGTSAEVIYRTVTELLDDKQAYARFARRRNPFGDGKAAQRIVAALKPMLGRPAVAHIKLRHCPNSHSDSVSGTPSASCAGMGVCSKVAA